MLQSFPALFDGDSPFGVYYLVDVGMDVDDGCCRLREFYSREQMDQILSQFMCYLLQLAEVFVFSGDCPFSVVEAQLDVVFGEWLVLFDLFYEGLADGDVQAGAIGRVLFCVQALDMLAHAILRTCGQMLWESSIRYPFRTMQALQSHTILDLK